MIQLDLESFQDAETRVYTMLEVSTRQTSRKKVKKQQKSATLTCNCGGGNARGPVCPCAMTSRQQTGEFVGASLEPGHPIRPRTGRCLIKCGGRLGGLAGCVTIGAIPNQPEVPGCGQERLYDIS